MQQQINELYLLYALRRAEIEEVALLFADALDEDHRVNADMFDVSARRITGNRHPNATMRALEQRLAKADEELLCLLASLLALGAELTLGLAEFDTREAFLRILAEEFAHQRAQFISPPALASEITAPKAEHLVRRLRAARAYLEAE